MNAIDEVEGVKVVDTGVKTNLVHDGDTSGLGLLVQLHHSWGDVGSGDDILLSLDSSLDDGSVVDIRDEGDGEVVTGDSGLEGAGIRDVEADGVGVGETSSELLGRAESSTGDSNLNTSLGEDLYSWGGNEAGS